MAFKVVFAKGACQVCSLDLGNDAIAHTNEGENHPIHRRCMQIWIDAQKLKAPICLSCSVNVTSIETDSEALVRFSEQGDLEAVKVVKKNGPFFFSYDLAVYKASENGHHQVVDELLSNSSISNESRGMALEAAAGNGHYEVVENLLLNKRHCEIVSDSSIQKSLSIARENGHENIVRMLEPLNRLRALFADTESKRDLFLKS